MNENTAEVLSLEDAKAFRRVCDVYDASLKTGITQLTQATEWVHEGPDGWDDDDYVRIKARVEGIIAGMTAIHKKIKSDLIPYVDAKIRILECKPSN